MSNFVAPLLGFRFKVEITGYTSGQDTNWSSVKGITKTLGVEELYEGGAPRVVYHLPTIVKYDDLVLERGIISASSSLYTWCKSTIDNEKPAKGYIKCKDIKVHLLNSSGSPIYSWQFIGAYPVAMAVGAFDATKDDVVIETITFKYNSFEKI
ncbi:MAG: phage tail protein [Flammeovirgaceae bacterium]|jgi:phage tail-like protein|nr:phage tail protein [Flammeovirgaceae bacterium]